MDKYEPIDPPIVRGSRKRWAKSIIIQVGVFLCAVTAVFLSWRTPRSFFEKASSQLGSFGIESRPKIVRSYNLTVGARWLNLDGGRWRPMFVCNGESPCSTLLAEEGDIVNLNVINDLGAQISIHWSGMGHRRDGFWNDGTGGLNQYPILPRGNWTSRFDTTGHWGLNWYADHTGAGVADGVYGMVYVAPSPSRPRPYSMIANSPSELQLIKEAEADIRHIGLWNSDFRTAAWKFDRLKGEGADLYCYKSILVNGKGRVFCRNDDYKQIDGHELDAAGCIIQKGFKGEDCKPSSADFEVVYTNGRPYVMLNLLNVGFEHALKYSIDDHQMWVVADDSGFVEPQLVDVVYITNGARITVLVKLDRPAADYTIRIASTSKMQNLESYAILRYPAKRYPVLGEPMHLPSTNSETKICLNPDSSVPSHCHELDASSVQPFPFVKVPKKTDLTLLWTAGSQQSKYEKHVTEYFVNEQPWQIFRAALEPVYFTKNAQKVDKPIQNGLPLGTVVDLIVQNTLNDTIPMYKHGDPIHRLGSGAYEKFEYKTIDEALDDNSLSLNVKNPPMAFVHDLPPLGWLAVRWKVSLTGATMFHAVKLRYFALGMAAPLLEGIEYSVADQIPEYAKSQPHVEFEPKNPGVFG